ncbi:MAG: serine/threonine-protein kinase [Pseudomonadota bacterium]
MRIRAGDILDEKFVVIHAGSGDAFDVMTAVDLRLDARVALRVVNTDIPEVRARFLRDAGASLRPRSEFIVQVLDYGTFSDGAAYLVTEYVDGVELSELIRYRPLSFERAIGCFLQTCNAVIQAHEMGLRAYLRTRNVLVQKVRTPAARVKVAGIGIGPLVNYEGQIPGSPAELDQSLPYMAPEELSGTASDHRADIWTLGIILYEAVAGRRPFRSSKVAELVTKILLSSPDLSVPSNAPPGVLRIISRCLQREPRARFDSVYALVAAVSEFVPRPPR